MQFPSLRGPYGSFSEFLAGLEGLPRRRRTLLVGIDGCGGSGKSTCGRLLAEARPDVTLVHMDDFYRPAAERPEGTARTKPIGADFDWERVRRQVLEPLLRDQPGRYQAYDWGADRVGGPWRVVPVGGIVAVEGVTATRAELRELYDFRIWVECP
ncbi:MAG: uridine kinase family protein, partial [Bacillota bacterium]